MYKRDLYYITLLYWCRLNIHLSLDLLTVTDHTLKYIKNYYTIHYTVIKNNWKSLQREHQALLSCSISNRVWESLRYRRFFCWMLASTMNKVPATNASITPATANTNDQPKKLLAWPGIQLSRLVNSAKTITAIPPQIPAHNNHTILNLQVSMHYDTHCIQSNFTAATYHTMNCQIYIMNFATCTITITT